MQCTISAQLLTYIIIHFNSNTCTTAHLCSYPVSQSCGSSEAHHADTGQALQLMFTSNTSNIRMKKCDLCDFNHGIVVDARWASLSISESANLLGISYTIVSRVCSKWC